MKQTPSPVTNKIEYYHKEGFVLCRKLVPVNLCNSIIAAFENEIIPYTGEILRSTSAKKEKHNLSESKMMTNPILQIQDLESAVFPQFQSLALNILGSVSIQKTIANLLEADPVLIQSVFYHSSMGTAPHEDSHYFDSADGRMLGCWIALEDISEEAGRFCVYPKTHNIKAIENISTKAVELYEEYQKLSLEVIRSYKNLNEKPSLSDFKRRIKVIKKLLRLLEIEPYSPALKKGDAIIFSSKLFHSSYDPHHDLGRSRTSLIGHFVPNGVPIVRYQKDVEQLNTYKKERLLIQRSQSY